MFFSHLASRFAWLYFFQYNMIHFCNKTRNSYDFLMIEIALKFNSKVHVSLCQYQLDIFVPSIQNWLTLDAKSTKIYLWKPSSASANLKLLCKPDSLSEEVLTIFPNSMFFSWRMQKTTAPNGFPRHWLNQSLRHYINFSDKHCG